MNTRCQSHSTSGFARLSDWGKKMKVKHGVQWRLLMVMNCIIFLDSVGLMFILKRDYRRSGSCSKQLLSRSYMYNI